MEFSIFSLPQPLATTDSPIFLSLSVVTLRGGSSSGGDLTLSSTSNATKGKILFGTSAYDEVNNRLGIGMASPAYTLDIATGDVASNGIQVSASAATNIPNPGVTSNKTLFNFRGFSLCTDSTTLSAGPTFGVGVAINRSGPALGLKNSTGASLNVEAGNLQIGTGVVAINTAIGSSYAGVFVGTNYSGNYYTQQTASYPSWGIDLGGVDNVSYSGTNDTFSIVRQAAGAAHTARATLLKISAAGSVGINETSPDYKLDVNGSFGFTPGSSVTPVDNGDVVIEATSNTSLTFKLKGSDGTVRAASLNLPSGASKRVLSTATTFYVRTGGSDSTGDGSANTDGAAFATINGAVSYLSKNIDAAGYVITISVADGTYTTANTLLPIVGANAVTIQGNTGTPANVVISTTSANCFTVYDCFSTTYTLTGIKMQTTTSGNCVVTQNSRVNITTVNFGACAASHILANTLSRITCSGSYTVSGSAARHWQAFYGIIIASGITITLSGTPAFSAGFAYGEMHAVIYCPSNTYSGSATGTRYVSNQLTMIYSGATLPGNAGGTTADGGLYV